MKLRYAPRAKADIAEIHAYIADRNAKAATAVISRLKAAAELMEEALRPLYRDHFAPTDRNGEVIWFTRDAMGVPTMHIGASRMRDMPFTRVSR